MVDTALVAAALKFGVKEGVDAGLSHFRADQPRADSDCIRVVVLSGKGRGQRLGDLRAAACRVAVGSDRNADSRSAYRDPALRPAVSERLGKHDAKARIIDAFVAVSSKVEDLMALLAEPRGKLFLEIDPGMVGGEDYAHGA